MRARGWTVITLDIDPVFEPDILADVRAFTYEGPTLDLVWASPPCDDFSRCFMPWRGRWSPMAPPDMSLVNAAKRIVSDAKPRHWIIENVKGAQRWLGPARWVRNPIYLWGEFPPIHHGPIAPWKERLSSARAAQRAEIPLSLSWAVADSIEQALTFS